MTTYEVPWPMGESDGQAPTPLIFQPKGFLVLILEDADHAERARATLAKDGFADENLRLYTSEQILADHASYVAQQGAVRRAVRAVTTDPETPELYFGYARDGRSALWVREPDRDEASRAVRALAGCDVLHVRYYGRDGGQDDIHVN